MRYFASPILTSLEGVHDADLADEDALAPPGAIIVIGVVSLLAVVTLRRDLGGASGTDTASPSPRAGRW
jgi:hypothetical protein